MSELIFMLTLDDRTVPDAVDVYAASATCRWASSAPGTSARTRPSGGSSRRRSKPTDGARSSRSSSPRTASAELAAIETGLELGVDVLMGGVHVDDALSLIGTAQVDYLPFPGRVVGHPSQLTGNLDEIVEHARQLAADPKVTGLDLLAWRWTDGEGAELARSVVTAVDVPVVVAGCMDRSDRIRAFAERFVGAGVAAQLDTVLAIAAAT